jgi:hypothetical protein
MSGPLSVGGKCFIQTPTDYGQLTTDGKLSDKRK